MKKCMFILIIVILCSCGSKTDDPVVEPIVVRRFDLGTYLGYREIFMIVDSKEKLVYALYSTGVSSGIYYFYKPTMVFMQDRCTLLREYQGNNPISTRGYVVCGDDLSLSMRVYITSILQ